MLVAPSAMMNRSEHTTGRIFAPGVDEFIIKVSFRTPLSYSELPGPLEGENGRRRVLMLSTRRWSFVFFVFVNST